MRIPVSPQKSHEGDPQKSQISIHPVAPKDPKKAIVEDWEIDAFSVKRCLDGLFRKADRAKRLGDEMAAPVSET